jgi:hypothetical protein
MCRPHRDPQAVQNALEIYSEQLVELVRQKLAKST